MAGAMQSASLYFVFGFRGLHQIAPYLIYFLLSRNHPPRDAAVWTAAVSGTGSVQPDTRSTMATSHPSLITSPSLTYR